MWFVDETANADDTEVVPPDTRGGPGMSRPTPKHYSLISNQFRPIQANSTLNALFEPGLAFAPWRLGARNNIRVIRG